MGIIKKLASQTLVYGLSSMLGRFINFLLVIPHTEYLKSVGSYGDYTTIFAFMAFFNILLSYGMDTTYFNFIRNGSPAPKVYAIAQKSIIFTTLLFVGLIVVFIQPSANFLGYPNKTEYVYICLIFLTFDTLSILPFARIRHEEKPLKFALIKLVNIFVNVSLNIFLLTNPPKFLIGTDQVTLILIANAVASAFSFILLSPLVFDIKLPFDKVLYRKMLHYAWPLIFVGLAGIVNETLDRTLIKRLLPSAEGSYQNGIYGAFYKLTMVMTMFVQAYRFAAEPLFFKQQNGAESNKQYANILYWFIGVCTFIFLACMSFIEPLAKLFIKNQAFFDDPNGLYVVPILLLANMFLGIYYNLSLWYRFTNNTKKGALISSVAAFFTIVLNITLIPFFGFVACAWITLGVYAGMCVVSYIMGRKYMPIPYQIKRYLTLILASVLTWRLCIWLNCKITVKWQEFAINILLLSLMLLIIWMLQPKRKNA
ncbi:MAG: oligosaccharide flippase family protein [Bacteroidia bacterium]|nr:oligosaccharide flippase family protein [Bacteroidia bacterium]